MGEISAELKQFKSSVEPEIGNMSSKCSTLQSTIQSLSSSVSTAKSGISNYYQSENKDKIINKFSYVGQIYEKIATSLGSDLQGMISDAGNLCEKVAELETINEQIAEQQAIVNANLGDTDAQKSKKNAANQKISELNKQFEEKHEEAKTKLTELKGRDSSLSFTTEFSPSATEANIDDLQYGTFEPHEFVASNGLKIQYWLYVPDYGKEVENLPVMLYMHGGSDNQHVSLDGAKKYGLTSHIANQRVTPSGIVIMPAVCDFSEKGRVALKELTDSVVEEYNCDTDRISVSGHSYGGITAYRLVNENPDYFSCVVAISGSEKVTDAFDGVKVWSFNGTSETKAGYTSIMSGERAVKEVNEVGGEAKLTALKTGHAGTNKITYEQEYESPDGDVCNPLDWAFRQIKASWKKKNKEGTTA